MIKKILLLLFFLILVALASVFITKKQHKFDNKKLVFWSIQLKPVYEKQINRIISDFEKSHPDYKVVWVDIPIQEAQKRTLASVLSSNPPDLVNLNPDFSIILAQKNALYIFNENDTKQYNKSLVNKLKYNGKIYALPYYATSPVTIYNKKLYEKCIGGSFIKYYSELESVGNKLKNCTDIPVFSLAVNENDAFSKILNKHNVFDMKTEYQINKTIEIYSLFDKLYKNNQMPADVLTINHRENIEKYMSNQALITIAGSNFINIIKENSPKIYAESEISNQLVGDNERYDISLMNLIIPSKSKNKTLALEFAKILTNKENQLEFSKLTNVLPVNNEALKDDYFKNCSSDLYEKSRCISSSQLDNIIEKDFGDNNKKSINEEINKTLEEILLNKEKNQNMTIKIKNLSQKIELLQTK